MRHQATPHSVSRPTPGQGAVRRHRPAARRVREFLARARRRQRDLEREFRQSGRAG